MNADRLSAAISGLVPTDLAGRLVYHFIEIRSDVATQTLERVSAGKFVETFVQCAQHLASGNHEAHPRVDEYLSRVIESQVAVPESLRLVGARIARAIYTIRNKRNVAHIGEVDPNSADLAMCYAGACWIVAEMLRLAQGISFQEASNLTSLVQAPVGSLIEDINGIRLVLADVSIEVELLILMHSKYPNPLNLQEAACSLSRRSTGSIRNKLRDLHNKKLAQGSASDGYRLTRSGFEAALAEVRSRLPR